MNINKEFTITFTPKEVEQILKDHIRNMQQLVVDNVIFNIETKTNGYGDYPTEELTKIICKGKLEK
jgi:hypothetical protein